ncbi:MAG: xanthine dehydrogenase accessory protein XdhC [Alphaproteobacteria bacterium]
MTTVNHEWLPVLTSLTEKNEPCVLITVMEAKGSTPREAGTKMVVTVKEQFGTIGGGNLEFQAIDEARKLLASASGPAVKDYPLGPKLAQCCGGAVSVFLEPFVPTSRVFYLFGAGHVGKEVVKVLDGLPLRVKWVDERGFEFPKELPKNCEKVLTTAPVAELREADENSYIAVMTHSHDLDYEVVRAAFKGKFAYLGLIGSKTKRVRFEKRLIAEGITKEQLKRLHCPIGLGDVNGKHPREIAISVAAELLSLGITRRAVETESEEYKEAGAA